MNGDLILIYTSLVVDGVGLGVGLLAGLIVTKRPENRGFRYGAFYSVFAAVLGGVLLLNPIIFYIGTFRGAFLGLVIFMNLLLAAGWVWLCMRAYRRRFCSFVTISIPPSLGIWLIPLTIWNIYYGMKQRRSNQAR